MTDGRSRRVNGRGMSDASDTDSVKPIAMRDKRATRIKTHSRNGGNVLINDLSSKNNKPHRERRKKRHVGPHDEKGLQRLLSTGSLMPTLLPKSHPDYNHSIDLVFATYWFFPAKTKAILPEDQKCIEKRLSEETIRFDPKSKCKCI